MPTGSGWSCCGLGPARHADRTGGCPIGPGVHGGQRFGSDRAVPTGRVLGSGASIEVDLVVPPSGSMALPGQAALAQTGPAPRDALVLNMVTAYSGSNRLAYLPEALVSGNRLSACPLRAHVDPRLTRFSAGATASVLAVVFLILDDVRPLGLGLLASQAAMFAFTAFVSFQWSLWAQIYARFIWPRIGAPTGLEDARPARFARSSVSCSLLWP